MIIYRLIILRYLHTKSVMPGRIFYNSDEELTNTRLYIFPISTIDSYVFMVKATSVSDATATLDCVSEQCLVCLTDGEELKNR